MFSFKGTYNRTQFILIGWGALFVSIFGLLADLLYGPEFSVPGLVLAMTALWVHFASVAKRLRDLNINPYWTFGLIMYNQFVTGMMDRAYGEDYYIFLAVGLIPLACLTLIPTQRVTA